MMSKFNDLQAKIYENFGVEDFEPLGKILKKYGNRRIAFTDKRGISTTNIKTPVSHHNMIGKPNGFWYSLGSEWYEFMRTDYQDPFFRYKKVYYLDIDYTNILRINTLQKLEDFNEKYKVPIDPSIPTYLTIDWGKVGETYKGIEIVPYRSEARYSMMWYYGWDISSGCIWDTTAIKGYKKLYPIPKKKIKTDVQ